jgi:EF-hand domain pair/EF hand
VYDLQDFTLVDCKRTKIAIPLALGQCRSYKWLSERGVMKIATLVVACIGLSGPWTASAQLPSQDRFARLAAGDLDHDGVITRAELVAYRRTEFNKFDRNSDGFLDKDDVPLFLQTVVSAERFMSSFRKFDHNRDNRVSREEFASAPSETFEIADADHDGRVTTAELSKAQSRK